MIKILLIAVIVVASNAQEKVAIGDLSPIPISPICYGLKEAPAEDLVASAAVEKSSEADLTEDEAAKLLGLNDVDLANGVASKAKRSAVEDNGAAEARIALSQATGNIIIPILPWIPNPCPSLLSTTSSGQELCPSYQQLYTRFWSSNGNGLCYILFPKWQRVYQTRCKCKTCRNSCPYYIFYKPGSLRFRNYCKPRNTRTRYVWALCKRNNFFRFIRERITQYSGGCECLAYKTCY